MFMKILLRTQVTKLQKFKVSQLLHFPHTYIKMKLVMNVNGCV